MTVSIGALGTHLTIISVGVVLTVVVIAIAIANYSWENRWRDRYKGDPSEYTDPSLEVYESGYRAFVAEVSDILSNRITWTRVVFIPLLVGLTLDVVFTVLALLVVIVT